MPESRILTPRLPIADRARLRVEYRIDGLGAWLAGHGYPRAAEWLWRACRMI